MFEALKANNSPFTELQIQQLQTGLGGLDAVQSAWLSGFIAGRLTGQSAVLPLPEAVAGAAQGPDRKGKTLHVFFASQTGNGEEIARELGKEAERAGLAVEVQSLSALRPPVLKKLEHAAFVISTHGEGDPPDDALDLFEYLASPRAARLEQLRFRVLALGDRSYSQFCAAGRKLENLLLAQGAGTFAERIECDIDFQSAATAWTTEVVRYGQQNLAPEESPTPASPLSVASHLSVVPQVARWNRARPFAATVERVQKITGLESPKDVYHVELSLQGSGLEYHPGDALGVWAPNPHGLVDEVLNDLHVDAGEEITLADGHHTAHELLTRHRELTRLSADTIRDYALVAKNADLLSHFEEMDEADRRGFLEQRQFVDLVQEFPARQGAHLGLEDVARILRPLAPRSYSIASSPASVAEEVHLTVATLFSNAIGTPRRGVASDFLNHRLQAGDEVGVFVEPNRRFRLPADRKIPLIFIGAGTGIAPYRAFLQQLEAQKEAVGESPATWLIFGNPHLRTDFLYQREWLDWRQRGLVARIDGAFSRDQAEKRYVQHVVREQAERIGRWLDKEARIYICGSLAMGHAVEQALCDVLAQRRGWSAEQAAAGLSELRRQGRLLKDLY